MANNAAFAGLGDAITQGSNAYDQARQARMAMMMMMQKQALDKSEIAKNNAYAGLASGKTAGFTPVSGAVNNADPNAGLPPTPNPPMGPPTLPAPAGGAGPVTPDFQKAEASYTGGALPAPTAGPSVSGGGPPVLKNPYGDNFRPPAAGETPNQYSQAHLAFQKSQEAAANKAAGPPAGAGGRSAVSLLGWASKQGLNRVDSAVNAFNRLTSAYNAGHTGDDTGLMQVAQGYAANSPMLSQVLQSSAGKPLTDADRASIYNGIRSAVADETNKLTGSLSAVSGKQFENASSMLPQWGDNAAVAASKFGNVKETMIKPALTSPLESLDAFRDPQGNFPAGLKALGANNVFQKLQARHQQVFGEPWSGSSPALAASVGTDPLAAQTAPPAAPDRASAIAAIVAAHKAKK